MSLITILSYLSRENILVTLICCSFQTQARLVPFCFARYGSVLRPEYSVAVLSTKRWKVRAPTRSSLVTTRGATRMHAYVCGSGSEGKMVQSSNPEREDFSETVTSGLLYAAALPYCIRKVPGSNFGWNTGYSDWEFSISLKISMRIRG
jgi:hypothetical protein